MSVIEHVEKLTVNVRMLGVYQEEQPNLKLAGNRNDAPDIMCSDAMGL